MMSTEMTISVWFIGGQSALYISNTNNYLMQLIPWYLCMVFQHNSNCLNHIFDVKEYLQLGNHWFNSCLLVTYILTFKSMPSSDTSMNSCNLNNHLHIASYNIRSSDVLLNTIYYYLYKQSDVISIW